jgi:preprotein translocase subunit SecY
MQGRQLPPSSPRTDVPEAVRVQILATEHWSLLATRSITYGAIFNRASIFLTVVSAAVVALALVAQATEFGDRFYAFASTSMLVGAIDAALAGLIAGLVAKAGGAGSGLSLFISAVVTAAIVVLLVYATRRITERGRRSLEPRFAR